MTPLPSPVPRPRLTEMSTVLGVALAAAAAMLPDAAATVPPEVGADCVSWGLPSLASSA